MRISEIFRSVQGEGNRTGQTTIFVRFMGCNLSCDGFGQMNPTDPTTYILPYQTIDATKITKLSELPVFEYGCDSSYSWHSKFKHLAKDYTAKEVADEIRGLLYDSKWVSGNTGNVIDLCFTGGEPMLNQKAMMDIMTELGFFDEHTYNHPYVVQIETNGTKAVTAKFAQYVFGLNDREISVNFNVSPKLFNVSGEASAVAWKPEVIHSYMDMDCGSGILKFVVNDSERTWAELNEKVSQIQQGVFPIYVMPVGATKEQQEESNIIGKIANRAIEEGYLVSGRTHCTFFGNTTGV